MRGRLLYLAAAVAYTSIGIYDQNAIYSYFEGAAFLMLFVVGLPALVRRLRR
jgi:hypothetical protein